MNHDNSFGSYFASHVATNLDAFDADPAEKLDLGFPLNQHMLGREAAWDLPGVVDGGGPGTMKVAAELALDQSRATHDTAAAQIPPGGDVHLALRADRAAEAGGDFVVAEIEMRAALRANRGAGGTRDLLLRFAIEAFDDRILLLTPQSLKPLQQRPPLCRGRGFVLACLRGMNWSQPDLGLPNSRRECGATLPAHCALRGGVVLLFEAAVRTFHTDLRRQRIRHY